MPLVFAVPLAVPLSVPHLCPCRVVDLLELSGLQGFGVVFSVPWSVPLSVPYLVPLHRFAMG